MSNPGRKDESEPRRRRYLVHLLCVLDSECESYRYIVRISAWASRSGVHTAACERAFADERELIATINPFLPSGSDVRDVFVHIESPTGFYYLLHLTIEEARQLGWNG